MNALELKVPPVAISAITAAAMWLAATLTPSMAFALPWRITLAVVLAGAGGALAIAGVLAFRKAKTTVSPMEPEATSSVVTSGVYGMSRNPMYVGILFTLASWAVFLANALPFAFLPAFVLYLNRFQIGPEEQMLSARFGHEYATYLRSVRRWL